MCVDLRILETGPSFMCAKLLTAMLLLLWVSFSSAAKWLSAMLPCGLALVNSLLAIVAPGQSYVRKVAH